MSSDFSIQFNVKLVINFTLSRECLHDYLINCYGGIWADCERTFPADPCAKKTGQEYALLCTYHHLLRVD